MDPAANTLAEIRRALRAAATPEAAAASRKFVPTSVEVYGVRLPVINDLARQHKEGGLPLVRALWKSGAFEECLLAAKILGAAARKHPEQTIALLEEFSSSIKDWAVCDTLGMQSVKPIAKKHQDAVLNSAKRLVAMPAMWQRRLGIVLLTHYAKEPARRAEVQQIVRPLRPEKEHYIKKALAWLDRDLNAKN